MRQAELIRYRNSKLRSAIMGYEGIEWLKVADFVSQPAAWLISNKKTNSSLVEGQGDSPRLAGTDERELNPKPYERELTRNEILYASRQGNGFKVSQVQSPNRPGIFALK